MSFVSDFLADLDSVRGIPDELGMRLYKVTVRVRTWTTARPGPPGVKTDVDTVLTVAGGTANPHVRNLTSKDVVASGGLYSVDDYRIGPLTPSYAGGGVSYSAVDPAQATTAREVAFKIEGGQFAAGGEWFERISEENTALHTNVIVRKSAKSYGP